MAREKTEIISFRIPTATAKRIDEQAEKERMTRAEYVRYIFLPAFDIISTTASEMILKAVFYPRFQTVTALEPANTQQVRSNGDDNR